MSEPVVVGGVRPALVREAVRLGRKGSSRARVVGSVRIHAGGRPVTERLIAMTYGEVSKGGISMHTKAGEWLPLGEARCRCETCSGGFGEEGFPFQCDRRHQRDRPKWGGRPDERRRVPPTQAHGQSSRGARKQPR